MWPWAHAAFGYLLYGLVRRYNGHGSPSGAVVIALGLGTQFPDLIDKPLAWYVHVLPYGRSFAHSLLTGGLFVLLPIVIILLRRGYREHAGAFALGYLSHLAGDGYHAALRGEWADLSYLVWPLLPLPATETEGLLAHLMNIEGSPVFLFGLLLTGVGLVVWIRDGAPGLVTIRDWLYRRRPASG